MIKAQAKIRNHGSAVGSSSISLITDLGVAARSRRRVRLAADRPPPPGLRSIRRSGPRRTGTSGLCRPGGSNGNPTVLDLRQQHRCGRTVWIDSHPLVRREQLVVGHERERAAMRIGVGRLAAVCHVRSVGLPAGSARQKTADDRTGGNVARLPTAQREERQAGWRLLTPSCGVGKYGGLPGEEPLLSSLAIVEAFVFAVG
jgi:hypothetical protein